jgi:glutaredoxin
VSFIEQYWPTMVGAVVLPVAGYFLWPSGDEKPQDVADVAAFAAQREAPPPTHSAADVETQKKIKRERSDDGEGDDSSSGDPRYEYRPYLIPVERDGQPSLQQHTQDDPEVQQALARVKVVLYEASWCGFCKKTRAFLRHNKISFTSRDVDSDGNIKEKARRLSGGTSIPVTVIDGEVVRGFSEAALQAALTRAVKRRIAATR